MKGSVTRFSVNMRMLWVIHSLYEFQALTDHFFMRESMLSDDLDMSDESIGIYPIRYDANLDSRLFYAGGSFIFKTFIFPIMWKQGFCGNTAV